MNPSPLPVVTITGASAGVGRAAARRFAREGHSVALIARGLDGLNAALRDVEEAGARGLALSCDVGDAAAVEEAAGRIESELGPIEVWVNNAMTSVFAPFFDVTPEEFERVTRVNYLGYVHGTMSALRRMKPRDRGVIVQVGSALAYRSIPLQSAYCGSKHAIVGFTDSLRSELLHDGSRVRLTAVHMPALNTPQFEWVLSRLPNEPQPAPPIFQPEVAADAIYFASRHRRREVWVGGSTLKTILGHRLAPNYVDRYLARNGYKSQQTDEPRDPERPDNLWSPVDADGRGDRGAHGPFDRRARSHSRMLTFSKAMGWLFSF